MVRRLVLLRHGQTDHNLTQRAQGHRDVPLNATGRDQAAAVAPVVAAYGPAFVVSSDLVRASGTAAVVAGACGLPVRTDARLREFSVGRAREGRTWAEFEKEHPEQAAAVLEGDFARVPGAESPAQALARFLPALGEAAEALGPGETGVLVAHGAVMRTAALAFVGAPAAAAALGGLDNCGFGVLVEMAPGTGLTPGPGGWRIHAWNRVAPGP